MDFFVMLTTPNGRGTPLTDSDGELVFFATKEAARKGAISSELGSEFGYEIFELGLGDQ